jgi:hypothetical protein
LSLIRDFLIPLYLETGTTLNVHNTLNVHTLNVHLKIGGVEAMHFELKDEERKRLRKERREAGGLPSYMPQRAQSLIDNWCREYEAYFRRKYYPSRQDLMEAEHYSRFIGSWDEIAEKVRWFLRNYLLTPIGRYKASLRKTLFAPTLSDFLEALNDLPFVREGKTPDGWWVDEDGEVQVVLQPYRRRH